jgi:glycosyltransferase 2 family protein
MKVLVKILVSLAALAMVLRLVSVTELKHSISSIPLPTIALIVTIFFLGQLLSSYKWWLLACSGGIAVPWHLAFRAYFVGMFVNCFGLGTVGGDVARGLVLGSASNRKATALASVFADRVHGLTVLALICVVAMAAFDRHPIASEYVVFLILCIVGVVFGWYFGPTLALKWLPKEGALQARMREIAGTFPHNIVTIAYVSGISLLFHLLQISMHQIMAFGFGIHIPWRILLITIPVINILCTLPISWNGLGVRENGYAFFLVPLISREEAIAFGAMWLLAMTTSSAIGGLISVFSPDIAWRAKETTDVNERRFITAK